MNRLKIVLPLLVVTLSVLISWALLSSKQEVVAKTAEREPPSVEIMIAEPKTLRLDVISQGIVAPRTQIDLVPEVSGKVIQIHPAFAAGGFFKEGETLVAIDPRDYEFEVVRARARVAEAERELLREEAEAEQAAKEWNALGEGEASDYVLHKPHLAERRAKLAAARADFEEARLKRRRCELKAPFDGRIRDKQVDLGQYVESGDEMATIYATDSAEIRLPVPISQAEFLNLPLNYGDSANAEFAKPAVDLSVHFGSQSYHWEAAIVRTEGALDEKTGMLYAVAKIANPFLSRENLPPLAVGQFVYARIEGRARNHLVKIAKSALRSGYQVYVVDAESRLRLRDVEVLKRDEDGIIVSGGILPGEQVMVAGVQLPVEGMQVRIREAGENLDPQSLAAQSESAP